MSTTRPVGSKVGVDDAKFPGTWIVKSNGPVNAVLVPENGGRGLRAPHYLLTDAPVTLTNGMTLTEVPMPTFFELGEVVRVLDGKFAGLYVVIADKGEKVNLAKLGGDKDRYLRTTKRGIERVSLQDVARELAERS